MDGESDVDVLEFVQSFDGEWDVSGALSPTTAMSKHCVVCTPTAEKKADEYGARRNASFAAVDEEEGGISGVWDDGN